MTAGTIRGRAIPLVSKPGGLRREHLAIAAALVGALSLLMRLALYARSFDFFGDEVIYTKLGESVVSGGFPRFDGQLFFLHGPAFFYLEAGWQRLLGGGPDIAVQILRMRVLNAVLGGATASAVVLLAARGAGSLRAGTCAGLLFALDPFCIRQNDRVLLETSMMLWVVLGYLVFMPLITRKMSRAGALQAIAAGLLFGAAILTKDEATLLTILPLLAAAVTRWTSSRGVCLITASTACLVYGGYIAVVAANGQLATLWTAKTIGLRRMLGLLQTTGFHQSHTPSIYLVMLAEAHWFAITYLTLLLAVPAMMVLVRCGGPFPRMLVLVYGAAVMTLAYAFTLGTLEEQELYLLVIPSIMVIQVGSSLVWAKAPRGRRARTRAGTLPRQHPAITGLLIIAVAVDLAASITWLSTPDDGYFRLIEYMASHVPAGSAIAAFDGTTEDGITQYAVAGRYRVGRWITPSARAAEHVRYAVVPWTEILQHYSYYSSSRVKHIVDGGRVLFSFRGRTYGDVVLYELPVLRSHATDHAS